MCVSMHKCVCIANFEMNGESMLAVHVISDLAIVRLRVHLEDRHITGLLRTQPRARRGRVLCLGALSITPMHEAN